MDDTILDDWFTKSQAATFLQVSEKTIERLARKGEIRRETRKRPGVRASPVYSPEDLDRVKNAQTPQVAVLPPQAEAGGVPALVPRVELPSFLQSLLFWCGRAAKGQAISQRQRGRSILRASRIHDPALAQEREAPRRQNGRVEDSTGGS